MKYYKEFIDKYGDIEVTFNKCLNHRIEYTGMCSGVVVRAITHLWYSSDSYYADDFVIKVGEKIKIKNLQCLETVDGIQIDKLMTMDNRGMGFIEDLSEDNKIKYKIIKITYDDENIFLKSEMVETDYAEDKDEWLKDCYNNLQDKLKNEIESGCGDKYQIASYEDEKEISNASLAKLANLCQKIAHNQS